jgi:protein-S-isoprenylcysteine O-methyltransferase Ste14
MTTAQPGDPAPDFWTRLGGWLFSRRTWLPLPIVVALLLVPSDSGPFSFLTPLSWLAVPLLLVGEGVRLWAVRHIGVISRTRSDRLGPLVSTGPFSLVRNPLYLGNILLWLGLTVSARLFWLAPLIFALLALEYHAIVRWEERLLTTRIGDRYREYLTRVPRWRPLVSKPTPGADSFTWRETLFSERGTLVAIVVGYLLIWVKQLIAQS